MAVGDDALAAGMTLIPGTAAANTLETIINGVLDEIARRTNAVTPVAKGGTGATAAPAARSNLGAAAAAHTHTINDVYGTDGTTPYGPALQAVLDSKANAAAVGAAFAEKVNRAGDTMTGDLFLVNSSAASSGWTSAFINSDGRVCRGASALKFKKYVSERDPLELGDIFPVWHRFQMKADGTLPAEGKWRYGPIADYMAANPDQEPFVVYDAAGEVESVDFTGLLLAQVAQLHEREKERDEREKERDVWIEDLLTRIETLENRA